MTGPLVGLRVVEFAAQGPGPFAGMLLADLGADVVLIERPDGNAIDESLRRNAIFHRGKRSIVLDLKSADGLSTALALVEKADCLIEGLRPGVMERLQLGPKECLERNPRLVYGRMTGWGQHGPLAMAAGHDLNYLALSGALWFLGAAGDPPLPPPTLLGDLGGGALYLALGLLAGVMHARSRGEGQVVDAAIVDGAASLSNILLSLKAAGQLFDKRGTSAIDGAHWYGTYRCRDGLYITVGAIESKFYAELLRRVGLEQELDIADQYRADDWRSARQRLQAIFETRSQSEWCDILEGTDCCFAPVLDLETSARHPHMAERASFGRSNGILQAAPAPRFSKFPEVAPNVIPAKDEHRAAILAALATGESGSP